MGGWMRPLPSANAAVNARRISMPVLMFGTNCPRAPSFQRQYGRGGATFNLDYNLDGQPVLGSASEVPQPTPSTGGVLTLDFSISISGGSSAGQGTQFPA
jgi:hypothetical protein